MKYVDYNIMYAELKPFFINGKRLRETELKWLEKKGAMRLEPYDYTRLESQKVKVEKEGQEILEVRKVPVTYKAVYEIICDLGKYRECIAKLDEFNRCEYGQQKRFEELQP